MLPHHFAAEVGFGAQGWRPGLLLEEKLSQLVIPFAGGLAVTLRAHPRKIGHLTLLALNV